MSTERPVHIGKKTKRFLVGLGITTIVSVALGTAAEKLTEYHNTPTTVSEAEYNFLALQQSVMNGLGPDSYVNPQPSQLSQRLNVDGRQYTFTLDKEPEGHSNFRGYKRTLTIDEKGQSKKYVIYSMGVVYNQSNPSIEGPGNALNLDQINKLSKMLKADFQKYQRTHGVG